MADSTEPTAAAAVAAAAVFAELEALPNPKSLLVLSAPSICKSFIFWIKWM